MDPTNPLASNTWTAVGPAVDRQRPASTPRSPAGSAALAVDPSDPSGNTVYVGGASRRHLEDDQLPDHQPDRPDLHPADRLRPDLRHEHRQHRRLRPQQRPQPVDHLRRHRRGRHRLRTGVGFLRSMDGGATWTLLDSTDNTLPFAQRDHLFATTAARRAFKVVVDPTADAHRRGDRLRGPQRRQRRHLAEPRHAARPGRSARRRPGDRRRARPDQRHGRRRQPTRPATSRSSTRPSAARASSSAPTGRQDLT